MVKSASEGVKERILLVEDEEDIRDLIELRLRREGYEVETHASGESFVSSLRAGNSGRYALAILDWMLPGMSGVGIAQMLRSSGTRLHHVPILMVTARTEASDIVLGLESGADDYLAKPFEVAVLLARVRALLRRSRLIQSEAERPGEDRDLRDKLRLGALEIDLAGHRVFCEGAELDLTPSEYKLLVALASNRGRVLTRDQLIAAVQGAGVSVVDRAVDTHVFGLRKKLGKCSELIETVRGVGYRVGADE